MAVRYEMTLDVANSICADAGSVSKLSYDELKEALSVLEAAGGGSAYADAIANIESKIRGDMENIETLSMSSRDFAAFDVLSNNYATTEFDIAYDQKKAQALTLDVAMADTGDLSTYSQVADLVASTEYVKNSNFAASFPSVDMEYELNQYFSSFNEDTIPNVNDFESIQYILDTYPNLESGVAGKSLKELFAEKVREFDELNGIENVDEKVLERNSHSLETVLAELKDSTDYSLINNLEFVGEDGKNVSDEEKKKSVEALIEAIELETTQELLNSREYLLASNDDKKKLYEQTRAAKESVKAFELLMAEDRPNVSAKDMSKMMSDPDKMDDLKAKMNASAKNKFEAFEKLSSGEKTEVKQDVVVASVASTFEKADEFAARIKQKVGKINAVKKFNDKVAKFDDNMSKKFGKKYTVAKGILGALSKAAPAIGMAVVAGTGPVGMACYGVYQVRKSTLPLWKKFKQGKQDGKYQYNLASFKQCLKDNKRDAFKAAVGTTLGMMSMGVASVQAIAQVQEIGVLNGLTQNTTLARRIISGVTANGEKAYDLGVAIKSGDKSEIKKKAAVLAATSTAFLGGMWLSDQAKEAGGLGGLWGKVKGWFGNSETDNSVDGVTGAGIGTDVPQAPATPVAPEAPVVENDTIPARPATPIVGNDSIPAAPQAPEAGADAPTSPEAQAPEMPAAWNQDMGITQAQFNKLQSVYGADKLANMYANLSKEGVMNNFEGMTKEQVMFKFQRLDAWTDRVGADGKTIEGASRYHFDKEMKDLNRLLNCGETLTKEELAAANSGLGAITKTGDYTGPGKTALTNNVHIKGENDDCDSNKNTFKMGGKVQEKVEVKAPVQEATPKVEELKPAPVSFTPNIEPKEIEPINLNNEPVAPAKEPETLVYNTADGGKQPANLFDRDGDGKAEVYQDSKGREYVLRDAGNGTVYPVDGKMIDGLSEQNSEVVQMEGKGKKAIQKIANEVNNNQSAALENNSAVKNNILNRNGGR